MVFKSVSVDELFQREREALRISVSKHRGEGKCPQTSRKGQVEGGGVPPEFDVTASLRALCTQQCQPTRPWSQQDAGSCTKSISERLGLKQDMGKCEEQGQGRKRQGQGLSAQLPSPWARTHRQERKGPASPFTLTVN